MKKILFAIFLTIPYTLLYSQEYNNGHKYYIESGLSAGSNYRGGAFGYIGSAGVFFDLFGKSSAIDLRSKSLYTSSPEREVGALTATYRLYLKKGFYLGAGTAHNHEADWNEYLENPIPYSLGLYQGIIHRTGFCFETGYDGRSLIKQGSLGIYPVFNLNLTHLIYDNEPTPYVIFSIAFRFGFKEL